MRRRRAPARTGLWAVASLVLGACAGAPAAAPPAEPRPAGVERVQAEADAVSEADLRATVAALVDFGTRHTLSADESDARGLPAARRWVAARFAAIGAACGGCIEVVTPSGVVSNARIPQPTEVINVLGVQRGSDPDRVIMISAHLDSRASDVMDAAIDAPGANDDASGVAAVIEAARILSRSPRRATVVYAALTGEEQGLLGAGIVADWVKAQGWRVEAVLNNDIIGNTEGSAAFNDREARVFSEGVRALETPEMARARASTGGELDSPSRNLARFLDRVADDHVPGLDVVMVMRTDRFGRGGDQIRMQEAGFPAVRISEAAENYARQHQDVRVENGVAYGDTLDGVDFGYLTRMTQLNVAALAILADAPPPPEDVRLEGAVTPDTTIRWSPSPGAAHYDVWRRSTTAPQWLERTRVAGDQTSLTLPGVVIDDAFFGVAAVGPDGLSGPVRFPGPIGAPAPASVSAGP